MIDVIATVGLALVFGVPGLYVLVRQRKQRVAAIAAMDDYDFPEDNSDELEGVPLPDGEGL